MEILRKLPFSPIDYLRQDYGSVHNEFVNNVIGIVRELNDEQVQDSIVIGFDVFTASVKKIDNADLVAAIDQENGTIGLTKQVRITDDPSAPLMRVDDTPVLPLSYQEIKDKVKVKCSDIKFNNNYNKAMSMVKQKTALCQTRYLDSKKKKGTKKELYSETAVDEVIAQYDILSTKL